MSRVWTMGWCAHCGKPFVVANKCDARYCSETHKRRGAKDRRRARRKGVDCEPYNRSRIFERDNWCCQLCGDPVERDAYYKDPTAATIDHITPMGRGGADAPHNLQTAHRICNLERNAIAQANV